MTQQPSWPQPQPQGPPPGYGQPQAQYPPADVAGNPWPTQGQPQAGGDTPFNNPGPAGGGGDNPSLKQLVGRLLIIKPYRFDAQAFNPSTPNIKPQDQVMANVIVCDGPPIEVKMNRDGQVVATFDRPKVAPFYIDGCYFKGTVITPQLESFVASRGVVLARLVLGQARGSNTAPYLLQDPTPEDQALATPMLAAWDQIKAQSAPPAPPQYAMPEPAPQQYQQGPPPGYGQPPVQQGYAPPQQYAQPQQGAPWPQPQGSPPPWAGGQQ